MPTGHRDGAGAVHVVVGSELRPLYEAEDDGVLLQDTSFAFRWAPLTRFFPYWALLPRSFQYSACKPRLQQEQALLSVMADLADQALPDVVKRQRAAVIQRIRALQLRRWRLRH
jgi:hypothetical protein